MTVAGDTHPTTDEPVTPAGRERRALADETGTMSVGGNPTARELAAVTAAVTAARRVPSDAGAGDGEAGAVDSHADANAPGTDVDAAGVDGEPPGTGVDGPDSRERVAHERRCPVCRERYDSTRQLDGPTSLRTAKRGASTVCIDPGTTQLYVHSPPPR